MKLRLHRYAVPTRHPFTIARGSTTLVRTLVVELEHDGVRGYGEAGESDHYRATFDNMTAALERVRAAVESAAPDDPAALWQALQPQLAHDTFAHCALDLAAWDLWGKLRGEPLWKAWGLSLDRCPPSDYTIGIDTSEVMIAKLQEFPGWPVYKIKLGTPRDVEVVRTLRKHTSATFRVDANEAWSVEETLRNAAALAELGVEYIEQPLKAANWEGMRTLRARSALPLVADESCRVESDVERCVEFFHGVNVKLVKCGGLTPARRMLVHARRLGLKTMIGCMCETSVGISAAAQLLPLVDYADLDGAVLLAEDVAQGVTIRQGRAEFPDTPGCGVGPLK